MNAPRDGEASTAAPVSDGEQDTLFAGFRRYPRIALAVSGGADSIALMRLAHAWAAWGIDAPRFTVLTVDHGLRAAAASEAEWVKSQAAAFGLEHHTLVWEGAKPATGVQAKARAARYSLLCGFCRERGIPAIATAHTADDQAETLLMRLRRGSGIDGLAGMAGRSRLNGVDLLRPLLGVSRARLVAWLHAHGQHWVDDPSNDDDHYERVRVRRSLASARDGLGLSAQALALSAARLRRARDAIEEMTTRFLCGALIVHEAGYGEIALTALHEAPGEIALQSLGRMACIFGRPAGPLRMTKLEAVHALLRAGGRGATLGGCRFAIRQGALLAVREFGRMKGDAIPLRAGDAVLWDGRFTVAWPHFDAACLPGAVTTELTLRSLGSDGLTALARAGGNCGTVPRIAALALPSLWCGESPRYAPFVVWPKGAPPEWLADCEARFIGTDTPGADRQ
jgi:tRNA(Ile)-lysidine synthase